MLEPLKQWICDRCGEVIETPETGFLEWFVQDDYRTVHEIVHGKEGCYPHRSKVTGSYQLDRIGMNELLSFLDVGPYIEPNFKGVRVKDMREFVKLMRRLTIPYYEEARLYLKEAHSQGDLEGLNAISLYEPERLKALIERYSPQA